MKVAIGYNHVNALEAEINILTDGETWLKQLQKKGV